MQRLACAALALLLAAAPGCRKKQASETGGMPDTTTSTPTPAPAPRDTAPAVREFGFDQRQEFAQSIRQQLAQADQQIKELSAQVKSRGGAVSDRALARIRASRQVVSRDLKRINTATAANWEQVKRGVNQSLENLNNTIEGAQPK
jgi:hypothetical protein